MDSNDKLTASEAIQRNYGDARVRAQVGGEVFEGAAAAHKMPSAGAGCPADTGNVASALSSYEIEHRRASLQYAIDFHDGTGCAPETLLHTAKAFHEWLFGKS